MASNTKKKNFVYMYVCGPPDIFQFINLPIMKKDLTYFFSSILKFINFDDIH